MKTWNTPQLAELAINETAEGHNFVAGNSSICIYDANEPCNANGKGKGKCNNCPLNPSSKDGDTNSPSC